MRIFKDMDLVEQLGSGVCKYTNLTDEGARNNPDNVQPKKFDAIVLGVAHKEFLNLDLSPLKKEVAVVYDVKGVLEQADMKL